MPDLDALVGAVLAASPVTTSLVHGELHWRAVAGLSLDLAGATPGADPLVCLLFGLLHDSQRRGDGVEPGHGGDAARFARTLHGQGLYQLAAPRRWTLHLALEGHSIGFTSADPTIGCCWDADRLDLRRLGVRPDPRRLSTPAARKLAASARGGVATRSRTWEELLRCCTELAARRGLC